MLRRMFDFLRPRWKKDARHLVKGARKFVHYKRDVLDDGRIAEIESRRDDLRRALKSGDRKLVEEAGKQLRARKAKGADGSAPAFGEADPLATPLYQRPAQCNRQIAQSAVQGWLRQIGHRARPGITARFCQGQQRTHLRHRHLWAANMLQRAFDPGHQQLRLFSRLHPFRLAIEQHDPQLGLKLG